MKYVLPIGLLAASAALADYRTDIGYDRIPDPADGASVSFVQVEAPVTWGHYMPDTGDPQFSGKTLTNVTAGTNGSSWHATAVGQYAYGNSSSIATGISDIAVYEAVHWMTGGFLQTQTNTPPSVETGAVQNHSWIANDPARTNTIRRFDYAIQRDGFTAVCGMLNNTNPLPDLLVHTYNGITVGRTDGHHSRGLTLFEGIGRVKPDLTVPVSLTSYAVPVVAACASMLLDAAATNAAWSAAAAPEAVKAILMAGATKAEFSNWSRTAARPLDPVYGAGELNAFNSWNILAAGPFAPGTTNASPANGWHTGTVSATATNRFRFQVGPGRVMTRLSCVAAWLRQISDGPGAGFDPVAELPDIDIRLEPLTNGVPAGIIDQSTSRVDNVEHIWLRDLTEGTYELVITCTSTAAYAVAWHSVTADIPAIQSAGFSNGAFRIEAAVSSNITHALEVSTNLRDPDSWELLVTSTPGSNRTVFVDTAVTNHPVRFYRVNPDP